MTLEQLINKLQTFNCDVLKNKEVAHFFMSSGTYTYLEKVSDVCYDAKKGMFRIECENPVQCWYDDDYIIKSE